MFTIPEREKLDNFFEKFTGFKDNYGSKISNNRILFEKFGDNAYIKIPKVKDYLIILENAYQVLLAIKKTTLDNDHHLKNFVMLLKDKTQIDQINKIGKDAKALGLSTPHEIVSKFSKDLRYKAKEILKIRQNDEKHKIKYINTIGVLGNTTIDVARRGSDSIEILALDNSNRQMKEKEQVMENADSIKKKQQIKDLKIELSEKEEILKENLDYLESIESKKFKLEEKLTSLVTNSSCNILILIYL